MRRIYRWILWMAVLAAFALSPASRVAAQSGEPTPEVVVLHMQESASLPWYVGILLLLAIFVGLTIYKNRYQAARKKKVLNAACCAPIVEDGESPFHPVEDETGKNS